MFDWASTFEEQYPAPGASPSELALFREQVGLPPPPSHLSFLSWSNGGEFRTGQRWFQFFPALDPIHGIRAMADAYHLPRYMPGALPFAFNGSGTFYLFDMRRPPRDGEYPIACASAGNLGWSPDEFVRVADTFEAACRGDTDVDELLRIQAVLGKPPRNA